MSVDTKKTVLKKYTPTFIEETDEFEALLVAIATELDNVDTELSTLPVADRSGKGLQLKSNQGNVLKRISDSDSVIEGKLEQQFDIAQVRGTEAAIKSEISHLSDADEEDITLYGVDEVGDIVDVTYFDDDVNFMDVHKMVIVERPTAAYTTNSVYGTATYGNDVYSGYQEIPQVPTDELISITKQQIIPIDTELLIKEVNV